MEIRRVLLTLLIIWNTIASQPVTNEDERHTRQTSIKECCPCPVNESSLLSDQDTSPTNTFESMLDDCPCRGKAADSMPDSSIFSPALQVLHPLIKAVGSKPDLKPLLKPEVGLASSVLETLREATDEEYKDALARDAARNAIQFDLPLLEAPIDTQGGIINIILNPDDAQHDFDVLPEESHIQETRCIHSPLSNINMVETEISNPSTKRHKQNLKFPNIKNLHTNLFDMDNSPSNIKEQTYNSGSFYPFRKLTSLRNPNLFSIDSDIDSTKDNKIYKVSDENLSNTKSLDLKFATIINNLKKSKQKYPIDISKDNTRLNNNQDDATINEQSVLDNKSYIIPLQNLRAINNLKPALFRNSWQPIKIKNLLKLKDVEFIPPTKNKKQAYVKVDRNVDNDIEINDLLSNDNFAAIDKSQSKDNNISATQLSDVLPSPSNNNIISTQPNKKINIMSELSQTNDDCNAKVKNEDLQNEGKNASLSSGIIINKMNTEKETLPMSSSNINIKQLEIENSHNDQTSSKTSSLDANRGDISIPLTENENTKSTCFSDITNDTIDSLNNSEDQNINPLHSVKSDILQVFDDIKRNNEKVHKNAKLNVHNFLQSVNGFKIPNTQNKDSWTSMDCSKIMNNANEDDTIRPTLENCTVLNQSLSFKDLQEMSDSVLRSSSIKQNVMNFNKSQTNEITSKEPINIQNNISDLNIDAPRNSLNKNGLVFEPLTDNQDNIFKAETNVGDNNEKRNLEDRENLNIKSDADRKTDIVSSNIECDIANKKSNFSPVLESAPTKMSNVQSSPMETNNENEMNAEASEPVYNRFLPTNQFRSSVPQEINSESNVVNSNSYRYLIEKRLQEISDILKSNQAACDNDFILKSYNENLKQNNQFQSDSSNIVPKLKTRGEFEKLPNKIEHYPRFQGRNDLEKFNLNSYKTRINSPEILDRKPLQSAYDGSERTLSVNKLQDHFAKQNPETEFSSTNHNNNILRNSDTGRSRLSKNMDSHKPNGFIKSLTPINQFSNDLKSQAKESFKSIHDALETTLKSTKPKNELFEKSPISKDLHKDLSRKRNDFDNKLQSWQVDLNDKLQSFHRNFDKPSNFPRYNNLLGSSTNNVPFGQSNDKFKKNPSTPVLIKKDYNKNLQITPVHQFKEMPTYLRTSKDNYNDAKKSFKDIADKSISNTFQDTTKKLYGQKNIIGSDNKVRWPENHKLRNSISFTTIRPSPLETLKKSFEKPFRSQGNVFRSQVNPKPPNILRNGFPRNEIKSKSNDPSHLASEIVSTRAKVPEHIIPKKPMLQTFRESLTSAEQQKNTKDVPNLNNEGSQHKALQAPKLPFKLNPERAPILSKILQKARTKPLPTLVSDCPGEPKNTNDSIEAASENVKTISVMEEPLKENVSYKCKMLCYKDNQ